MEKITIVFVALTCALIAPLPAHAVEVAGELLNVYGKIHMSVDYSDTDGLNSPIYSDGISISSNSSRLGFKGKYEKLFYQIEQEVRLDDGATGNFADRDTFIGITGAWGNVRIGINDSPFKLVASDWGIFGDSVGERRSILGASHQDGNVLNERPNNMVMYQFKNKTINAMAMYAVDPEGKSTEVDNNKSSMYGAGAWWNIASFTLSAGYEDWTGHSAIGDGSAYRLAAIYNIASHQIGAIYEKIDPSVVNTLSRAVYGAHWKWKFSKTWDVRLQYLIADSAKNAPDTGANKIGAGAYHQFNKMTKLYIAYGATSNDANASYRGVDGGHGDKVSTVNGGNPSSLSTGIEFKF